MQKEKEIISKASPECSLCSSSSTTPLTFNDARVALAVNLTVK